MALLLLLLLEMTARLLRVTNGFAAVVDAAGVLVQVEEDHTSVLAGAVRGGSTLMRSAKVVVVEGDMPKNLLQGLDDDAAYRSVAAEEHSSAAVVVVADDDVAAAGGHDVPLTGVVVVDDVVAANDVVGEEEADTDYDAAAAGAEDAAGADVAGVGGDEARRIRGGRLDDRHSGLCRREE